MASLRVEANGAEPRWQEDALGFLVAPVAKEEFFQSWFEREALVNKRGEPDRYSSLLTLDAVDRFVAGADLREGMIDLTSRKLDLSRADYLDEGGRVNRAAIADFYLRGATIVLPHLEEAIHGLGEFCRSLEEVFSAHVQTNVYLTPSGNQGFPIHYDNHDVFVIQISGAKAWRLYDTPVGIPYRGEGFVAGRHDPGPVRREFTLEPGDCAYVPRGLMHDAENVGDEPSLHITVGLIAKTWADLMLEAVSELALSEPEFRRSLPPGHARPDFDREPARAHFARLARLIGEKARMDGAFDLLVDNFIRGRRPDVAGLIAAAVAAPGPEDRFRRRRLVPWSLAEDEGGIVLVGPGGDLGFQPGDSEALERALSGEPFRPSDLACADPAALVRILWAGGYLERLG